MYQEVSYSSQVILPFVMAGILMMGAGVAVYFFIRLRAELYLATLFFQLNALVFTFAEGMINLAGVQRNFPLGAELYRIQQLISVTAAIFIPWLLSALQKERYQKIQRALLGFAIFLTAVFFVIAYGWPNSFVSVTIASELSASSESSFARGAHGPFYAARDLIIGVMLIYVFILAVRLYRLRIEPHNLIRWLLVGLIVTLAIATADHLDDYLQYKKLLPQSFNFSYRTIGLSVFSILMMYGVFLHFIGQLEKSEKSDFENRRWIHQIINAIDSVLIGVDGQMAVRFCNEQALAKINQSRRHPIGSSLEHALPTMKPIVHRIKQAMEQGDIFRHIVRTVAPDDRVTFEELKVLPFSDTYFSGAVLQLEDITDKKRTEELLAQTEKMISVGGLAAGMAHEINNPLSGMLQSAQVVEQRLSTNSKPNLEAAAKAGVSFERIAAYHQHRDIPKLLKNIQNSGMRAAAIVKNMLGFVRQQADFLSETDISKVIEDVLSIANADWDLDRNYDFRKIRIVCNCDSNLSRVACDVSKIEQVLFNLLKNAAQAMAGQETASEIHIRASNIAEGIKIEVADTGPGIPDAVVKRIFEPFYSTKPIGAGTGLGLSVAYFIVTSVHGGQMYLKPETKRGACFVIELPFKPL